MKFLFLLLEFTVIAYGVRLGIIPSSRVFFIRLLMWLFFFFPESHDLIHLSESHGAELLFNLGIKNRNNPCFIGSSPSSGLSDFHCSR